MKPFAVAGLPPDELNSFLSGTHSDPFRILGPHRMGDDLAIRAFRPDARKIEILRDGQPAIEAEKIQRDGFFIFPFYPGHLRDFHFQHFLLNLRALV